MFKKKKKVEKKVVKKVEKKVVEKKIEPKKAKTSFDVVDGKEVVRTFKKEAVAKSWADERGLKVK